jgi:hypothetical protein
VARNYSLGNERTRTNIRSRNANSTSTTSATSSVGPYQTSPTTLLHEITSPTVLLFFTYQLPAKIHIRRKCTLNQSWLFMLFQIDPGSYTASDWLSRCPLVIALTHCLTTSSRVCKPLSLGLPDEQHTCGVVHSVTIANSALLTTPTHTRATKRWKSSATASLAQV